MVVLQSYLLYLMYILVVVVVDDDAAEVEVEVVEKVENALHVVDYM